LGDDHIGSFPLHDQAVDEVLERFLRGDQFFHDDLIDLINPSLDVAFLIDLGPEVAFDCLENYFLNFFVGEGYFLQLFA
jgi:hypothetical protein